MICYFGHHRSSSSYIRSILESVAVLTGRTSEAIHTADDYIPNDSTDILIVTNSSKKCIKQINFDKAFHLIRDPRDIVVSSYFSHLLSHKTDVWKDLENHRIFLNTLSQEDGLIHEIEECRKQQFTEMAEWDYKQANVLELKFEDFILASEDHWNQITDFVGIPIYPGRPNLRSRLVGWSNQRVKKLERRIQMPDWASRRNSLYKGQLIQIIQERSFHNRSGRTPGEEDVNHHYRKGVAGDWVNYFTDPVKRSFKSHWGELLVDLGYEKDMNW